MNGNAYRGLDPQSIIVATESFAVLGSEGHIDA
jgi:hypothetical protein